MVSSKAKVSGEGSGRGSPAGHRILTDATCTQSTLASEHHPWRCDRRVCVCGLKLFWLEAMPDRRCRCPLTGPEQLRGRADLFEVIQCKPLPAEAERPKVMGDIWWVEPHPHGLP